MLITGAQIKAARALAGLTQAQTAKAAGININTLADMEARGSKPLVSKHQTVLAVQRVLEAAGVEFTDGESPGVRLRR
jgi:transcriptional regulator with XRE-family HTH domain